MDRHFEDLEVLIQALDFYFDENGSKQEEEACMRVVQRLKPVPTGIKGFHSWNQHIREVED